MLAEHSAQNQTVPGKVPSQKGSHFMLQKDDAQDVYSFMSRGLFSYKPYKKNIWSAAHECKMRNELSTETSCLIRFTPFFFFSIDFTPREGNKLQTETIENATVNTAKREQQ